MEGAVALLLLILLMALCDAFNRWDERRQAARGSEMDALLRLQRFRAGDKNWRGDEDFNEETERWLTRRITSELRLLTRALTSSWATIRFLPAGSTTRGRTPTRR